MLLGETIGRWGPVQCLCWQLRPLQPHSYCSVPVLPAATTAEPLTALPVLSQPSLFSVLRPPVAAHPCRSSPCASFAPSPPALLCSALKLQPSSRPPARAFRTVPGEDARARAPPASSCSFKAASPPALVPPSPGHCLQGRARVPSAYHT